MVPPACRAERVGGGGYAAAMPESKHRRKNKNRPRRNKVHQPVRNPDPSPPWVPRVGVGLIIGAVVVILLGYLPAVDDFTNDLPLFGPNWGLVAGFALMISGFLVLIRWQ